MMLCKLSLKNIKKSFKDYTIYFFTLILGVAIFYVFNAIGSQTVLINTTKSTYEIIDLMVNMLSGVSVFVSFILGFLIIYASRFLIKRRNKEFGIYLTLGMSKRKISMILFFETLFIGLISLIVGLGVGVVLSQLMSILVANMFDADMTKFTFTFSTSACIKTFIYFGIMYLLVMLFNVYTISKCKLISLLYGAKKAEKVKLKNQVICTIIFIISVIILGIAYYLVTAGFEFLDTADKIFIPIVMGIVSTFFIFWSVSGLLLNIFMSMKKTYYKGLNSFILRQFSSKINTTVFSMTIICLMLFVTVCVLSSALSIKNSMTANLEELAPVDIELYKMLNLTPEDGENTNAVIEDSKFSVRDTLEKNNFNISEKLMDVVECYLYKEEDFTLAKSLGGNLDEILKKYRYLKYDSLQNIMKISDYNKIAKLYGNETYTLDKDEYLIIADFESMILIRNQVLKENGIITIQGKDYSPKYKECKKGFVEISSNHINDGIFIVPDDAVDESMQYGNMIIGNYKAFDKDGKRKINDELQKITSKLWNKESLISMNSKIDIADNSIGLGALVTFIGLYLGLIFLISSVAILSLKELSESTDNKMRFLMLRKIGVDEKLLNQALFRQIGIFFMFPLLIAIIHSIFGIKFCTIVLESFGTKGLLPSIIMTAIFIVVIYGGYFLLTYYCSKNIIKEK